jgi:hypothetical protein
MSEVPFSNNNSAPNKASTRSVLEKGLANRRAATDLINQMGSHYVAAMIVAAHVSQTTDFGALQVGDIVLHIPAAPAATDSEFRVCATAGTLGQAAVVGALYMVYRANNL